MTLKVNIIANYVGKGWSSASIFLFVPIYVHLLGTECYGLVAFYSILFSVVSIANVGLSSTLTRELAKTGSDTTSGKESRNLLRTIEFLFSAVAFSISIVVFFASSYLATNWLNSSTILPPQLIRSIQLMGLVMAIRLPADMYYAGLNGLQCQVTSNSLQAIFTTFRHLLSLAVLFGVSPTVDAFFLCQALSNLLELAIVRHSLWSRLPKELEKPRFSLTIIQKIYPYALGMAGISVISILLSQIDKIVVSKLLSIDAFAAYSLASLLARVPLILVQPIADAVHPRLTQLVEEKSTNQLQIIYIKACSFLGLLVYPTGIVIALYSEAILSFWSRSRELAGNAGNAAAILTIGSIFIASLIIPYYLALAHGWTSLNLTMGCYSVMVILPLTIYLTRFYGLTGASVGWLVLNAGILVPYVLFLHRKTLPGANFDWFVRCNFVPLVISVIVVSAFRSLSDGQDLHIVQSISWIVSAWIAATSSVAVCIRETRELLLTAVRLILDKSI